MSTETLRWPVVARGSVVGLAVMVPTTAVAAVLDHSVHRFADSGWAPLFALVILVAYALAGMSAGRLVRDAPLSNGAVAALGALVLWLPIRVLIWAIRHDEHGLFGGRRPVMPVGQLFLQAVLAVALGALGGALAARATQRRAGAP